MDIYGKVDIENQQKKFEDLQVGEIFCFVKDFCEPHPNVKVYMRGGHTSMDKTAMNLETGIMYSFDKYEPVRTLSATLNIKSMN